MSDLDKVLTFVKERADIFRDHEEEMFNELQGTSKHKTRAYDAAISGFRANALWRAYTEVEEYIEQLKKREKETNDGRHTPDRS